MSDALNDTPAKKDRCGCPISSRGIIRQWWWQRITAVLLVPLSVWFMLALVTHLLGAEPFAIAGWLHSPFVAVAMALLLVSGFAHARLGLHEIILDYVPNKCKKAALNGIVDILSLVLAIGSVAAILHLHLAA